MTESPDTDTLWLPLTQHRSLRNTPPMKIVSGRGCNLTSYDGREYLDGLSGLWCVNVGYGRRELGEVAAEQMTSLAYLSPTMHHEPGLALAAKLLELLSFDGHVYFATSGSEANEAAFKIARQFHLQTGSPQRYKIISRHRGYHGSTLGAMAATGQAERRSGYEPMPTGFIHIPPPYPYRRHRKFTVEEHSQEAVRWLEEAIIYEGAETVAAFILEPIISGGGVIVPPADYLAGVRRVCDEHGVLLICDEVVSGFGRTGRMFGHQHWNMRPDIITLAKGIASGYVPISAVVVSDRIFDGFLGDPGDLSHFRHINTYGGHPVSAAVALRNIDIIEREELVGRARQMGERLMGGLSGFEDHPNVGEVRGKGLLVGIELVQDKSTMAPIGTKDISAVLQSCKSDGILLGRNGNTVPGMANVVIVAPPLVITDQEVDRIVGAFGRALGA